jgi:Zn-dependent protease/CBS domain-containing protein
MRQSFSIGRIFGIDLRIHATWLLAFAFVTWGLASGYFRFIVPRQAGISALPLILGAISALLLFGSVLVHELSHSLVAQARGLRVRDITLFIFGGVSNIGGEARTARDEFIISAVGPLTSFLLAGLFWLLGQTTHTPAALDVLFGSARTLRTMTPLAAVLNYLTAINLLLGAFNLLPAFPLDGGRVFRSIVWGITRRYGRATTIAATVGQVFGCLMMAVGVVRVVLLGDLFGGLWTVFIGWFLAQSAGNARQDRTLREGLQGVPVSSIMDITVPAVDHATAIQPFVYEYLLRSQRLRFIVVQDGMPSGIVETNAINKVQRDQWPITPVSAIMSPVLFTVTPDADAAELLTRLQDRLDLIPVTLDGRVVGAVDLTRLLQVAQMRRELRIQLRPSTV